MIALMRNNPKLASYLKQLDKDTTKALQKYDKKIEETDLKMQEIYFKLAEERKVHDFGKFITKKGICPIPQDFASIFTKGYIWSRKRRLNFPTYLKYQKIISAFPDYLEVSHTSEPSKTQNNYLA